MRAIIIGCGRVGAGVAEIMARAGHDVTIIDITSDAFGRLEADFPGTAIRGDGTDEDVLRRAGAEEADWFFAMTEGDNRNVLTAQMAAESLGIPHVVAKVNDPVRSEAYRSLGIPTICRTTMMVDALVMFAGLPHDPSVVGVSAATGHHPGGAHDRTPAGGTDRETGDGAAGDGAAGDGAAGDGAAGGTSGEASAPDATSGGTPAAGARPRPAGTEVVGSERVIGAPQEGDGHSRRSWRRLRRTGERGSEG